MTEHVVKTRPIPFTAPMVRAILDGRKTQTRRITKGINAAYLDAHCNRGATDWRENRDAIASGELDAPLRCPYGKPGDRLWVRETWWPCETHNIVHYRADGESITAKQKRLWRSPIHMPRRASRITLELTGVRVERVHEISEADAIAEGAGCFFGDKWEYAGSGQGLRWFPMLWNHVNGPDSWNANPWVWVLDFKRVPQEASHVA